MMKITIQLNTISKYIQFWNGIFNLTKKELEVLTVFATQAKGSNLCSKKNKDSVAKILKIKDPNTLNNYVKRFKDKGAIVFKDNNYKLTKVLKNKNDITITVIR